MITCNTPIVYLDYAMLVCIYIMVIKVPTIQLHKTYILLRFPKYTTQDCVTKTIPVRSSSCTSLADPRGVK